MNGFGDELFARSAFATDEDRAVRAGDLSYCEVQSANRGIVAYELTANRLAHASLCSRRFVDRSGDGLLGCNAFLQPLDRRDISASKECRAHIGGEIGSDLIANDGCLIRVVARGFEIPKPAVDFSCEHVRFAKDFFVARDLCE